MKKIQKCLLALLILCLVTGMMAACTPTTQTTGNNETTGPNTDTETTAPAEDETTAPDEDGTTAPVGDEEDPTEPEGDYYTFKVVCEGTELPVENVAVQLCMGEVCYMPNFTNVVGIAKYELFAGYGEYDIHIISGIPEGYTFDNAAFKTNAEDKEYTLVLQCQHPNYNEDGKCTVCGKTCEHDMEYYVTGTVEDENGEEVEIKEGECKKCGCSEFNVCINYGRYVKDETVQGLPIEGVELRITTANSIIASGTTNAKGIFTFVAPKYAADDGYSGYTVTIVSGTPKGYYFFDDLCFMASETKINIECYTKLNNGMYTAFNPLKMYLDETTAKANGVLKMTEMWEDDEDTVQNDSLYFFSVTPCDPSHVGHYKLVVSGLPEGVTATLGHYASSSAMVNHDPQKSVTGTGEDLVLEFIMEERYMRESTEGNPWVYNNSWLFGIYVEGEENYPLELTITVEKDRDLIPGTDYTVKNKTEMEVADGTPNMSDIVGDVSGNTPVVFNGETAADVTLVLGADGYYHIGSEDGAILLVNITNKNAFFNGEASLATVNAISGAQNLFYSYWNDADQCMEVEYFHKLFNTYEEGKLTYTELCDANGYYAVNEQLYHFLRYWTEQRVDSLLKQGLDEEHAFLLLCGYYE